MRVSTSLMAYFDKHQVYVVSSIDMLVQWYHQKSPRFDREATVYWPAGGQKWPYK